MIPADCVMITPSIEVRANESSLTGEPDDLKKTKDGDCFLISSCLITEGEEVKAMAIGIGPHSQWGKIKANLVVESVNTPLQDKLQDMTTRVFFF
jgi:Ca2+-transporting ATPase